MGFIFIPNLCVMNIVTESCCRAVLLTLRNLTTHKQQGNYTTWH